MQIRQKFGGLSDIRARLGEKVRALRRHAESDAGAETAEPGKEPDATHELGADAQGSVHQDEVETMQDTQKDGAESPRDLQAADAESPRDLQAADAESSRGAQTADADRKSPRKFGGKSSRASRRAKAKAQRAARKGGKGEAGADKQGEGDSTGKTIFPQLTSGELAIQAMAAAEAAMAAESALQAAESAVLAAAAAERPQDMAGGAGLTETAGEIAPIEEDGELFDDIPDISPEEFLAAQAAQAADAGDAAPAREPDPDEEIIRREMAAAEELLQRELDNQRPIDLQKITLPEKVMASRPMLQGAAVKKTQPRKLQGPHKAAASMPQELQGDLRAWIEVDAAALEHNVKFLQSRIPERCRLMPALKAEAYGHGAVLVARQLNRLNVNAFCVACISEGIALRKAGIKGKILILGYTSPEDFPLLERYLLTQTVIDYPYAQSLNRFGKPVHVHIAIDTGMHRLGIRCEKLEEMTAVYGMKNLIVDGLFTHLSASNSLRPEDLAFTNSQVQAFYQVVDFLRHNGCPCSGLHLLASNGILNLLSGRDRLQRGMYRPAISHGISNRRELAADYVRPGIALYGVLETEADSTLWRDCLRPVLSLKARVVSVRPLYTGEAAGYGLAFTAKHDMRIATLAIGYADGLPRELSYGIGNALINGCVAPVIGRICMDQTIVDVSNVQRVQAGATAVLIGKSGVEEITVGHVADQCGTITNEILSRLGSRLNRILV